MKFIDLNQQYLLHKKKIDQSIQKVLNHGNFILGEDVNILEGNLKKFVNTKYCISTGNGTDSLLLSLIALGISKGDEVITTPFSWISTSETIRFLGAKPVYVDIDDSFLIDVKKIENKITKKTKAIMPVSLFGQTADLIKIQKIAKKYKISVIEDAAQSFGAKHYKKNSCSIADISCTSFFPTKPLGCYGDGGACFTNNKKIAEKLYKLRNHGKNKINNFEIVGVNSRLDTIQAAILNTKLKFLKKELQFRNKVANNYSILINRLNLPIITPIIKKFNYSVYAQYTIVVDNRKKIINTFKKNNIPFGIYYKKLLPEHQAYKSDIKDLKNSNKLKNNVISLPFSPYLNFKQQTKIVNLLKEAYS